MKRGDLTWLAAPCPLLKALSKGHGACLAVSRPWVRVASQRQSNTRSSIWSIHLSYIFPESRGFCDYGAMNGLVCIAAGLPLRALICTRLSLSLRYWHCHKRMLARRGGPSFPYQHKAGTLVAACWRGGASHASASISHARAKRSINRTGDV